MHAAAAAVASENMASKLMSEEWNIFTVENYS